jgi:protease-4
VEIFSRVKKISSVIWKVLTSVRNAVANIVFVAFIVVFLVAVFADTEETLEPNSILVLNPAGSLVEETAPPEPAEAFLRKLGSETAKVDETRTQDVINAINRAATDTRIKAMVIDPRDLQGCDTTKLLDVGKAIRDFKETGKPVLAHAMFYTQGQYLLASYAAKVTVSPLGGVLISGFGMYQTYFKGLLDKLRINFHVYRVGEYKTAAAPFMRDSMSYEAREQSREWLDGLWQAYLAELGRNRSLTPEDVTAYVGNIDTRLRDVGGDAARLAVTARLVDDIRTGDQFDQFLAGKVGLKAESMNRVEFREYLAMTTSEAPKGRELVGVIRARGPILPGKQPENMTGSESLGALLRKARLDPTVVAVVLRLDSPGGSAAASEEIHHEIARTQEAGKPVVVSMGSVAASGAYWIASGANRIVAAPTTLTGSIGIFAAFPTFENAAGSLGITSDGVGTTPLADLGNPLRPLSPQAEASIEHLLGFGYDLFVSRVAKGRRMAPEEVESVAQGKVFLGQAAQESKLVDQLGDLDEAIKTAGTLAGLSVVESKDIQREPSAREQFMQALFSSGQALLGHDSTGLSRLMAMARAQAGLLDTFADPAHVYARSLECEGSRF